MLLHWQLPVSIHIFTIHLETPGEENEAFWFIHHLIPHDVPAFWNLKLLRLEFSDGVNFEDTSSEYVLEVTSLSLFLFYQASAVRFGWIMSGWCCGGVRLTAPCCTNDSSVSLRSTRLDIRSHWHGFKARLFLTLAIHNMWPSATHPELDSIPVSFNSNMFHANSNQFKETFDFIQLSVGAESSSEVIINQLLGVSDLNSEQLQTHVSI